MRVFARSFTTVLTTGKITDKVLELPVGATAYDVMKSFGIGGDTEMMVLINQCPLHPDTVLSPDDKVVLMPPVSGA
jgi:molybdopterin converting factor small subunit